MNSPYDKTFDEILNSILTDYQNQANQNGIPIDTSQGTLIFIKSACMASAEWGLRKHIAYIGDQIFPDSANSGNLEHHAWGRNIDRTAGETDASLLIRVQDAERTPPAGGNAHDYIMWAKSIDNVAGAWSYPLARGDGTIDVVILANAVTTGSEIPAAPLLTSIKTYIDSVRPVGPGAGAVQVLAPVIDATNITLVGSGSAWDPVACSAAISAYLSTFTPDQVLFRSQIYALAVANGADDVTITTPGANVTPASHHMIRPGVLNVT